MLFSPLPPFNPKWFNSKFLSQKTPIFKSRKNFFFTSRLAASCFFSFAFFILYSLHARFLTTKVFRGHQLIAASKRNFLQYFFVNGCRICLLWKTKN
jgi:hypothetical protein